ncbi:C40 family peptidase [Acidimangrovimonas sediminis]|uniref:lipo-like protein n=1 Tax=Acidimangrovimonas sediminis TaxID=2056283 RepID=UPI001E5E4F37|nr:lipo-like protein [Acidimangrovimonas sediminis]
MTAKPQDRDGPGIVQRMGRRIGRRIARYLEAPTARYVPFNAIPPEALRDALRPGDVLLVEGDRRISAAIKYLTHSTWSHAAFYTGGPEGAELIEADLEAGVRRIALEAYAGLNTRICRPRLIAPEDREAVIGYMQAGLGRSYDLKNVIDLARYLMPMPPVPARMRRRMLALGSGDPTRAICSTLIAEAFQSVGYPILPERPTPRASTPGDPRSDSRAAAEADARRELMHIRHHSLFTPRDFDLSPYFEVVKPTLIRGFDYRAHRWTDWTPAPGPGDGGNPSDADEPDRPDARGATIARPSP